MEKECFRVKEDRSNVEVTVEYLAKLETAAVVAWIITKKGKRVRRLILPCASMREACLRAFSDIKDIYLLLDIVGGLDPRETAVSVGQHLFLMRDEERLRPLAAQEVSPPVEESAPPTDEPPQIFSCN